ncbi:MAG: EAL domain-containing protein [Porticoccaceae bacterium]|jgi:diguanylate cyclase (GGDEF)-like protein/PAS domain S-box-containing protein|nr:EAL domain-containing protein [Porticoccaceae bacterium]HLS98735.1 EAL domain-containing protein [Porticoccaceae bacterium]
MSSEILNRQALPAELLQALVDGAPQGLIVLGQGDRVCYWNHWVANWTGIAVEAASGRGLAELFPALRGSELAARLRQPAGDSALHWTLDLDAEPVRAVAEAMAARDRNVVLRAIQCRPIPVAGESWRLLELSATGGTVADRPARMSSSGDGAFAVQLESERFGILAIDRFGFIQRINDAMAELVGYREVDLHDKPIRILFPDIADEDRGEGLRVLFEARQARNPDNYLDIITADGDVRQLDAQILDGDDAQGGVVLLCRDMTRHVGAQEALFRQREHLSAIYNQVTDAILLVDRRGYLENSNPVASELLMLGHRRNSQSFIDDLLRLKDGNDNWVYPFSLALARERAVSLTDNIRLMVPGNTPVPVAVTATPVRDRDNRINGCVIVLRAVSESRRVSTRLSWHETHDPLTQLANRRQIENEIVRAIDAAHVDGSSHLFLYIDLYNFSVINDTCGHAAGDELLRQLARMLTREVGDQDVVARIGNDEFAVLLWARDPARVRQEAEAILAIITEFSVPWGSRRLKVGASIGVESISRDSVSEIDVLLGAGAACATAKEAGRNKIHYHGGDSETRSNLSQWTARISDALDESRFVLYCQPIVPVKGRRDVKHFEALVRMVDPSGNIVSPGKFIPAAEFSGLIDDIDRWVFEKLFSALEALPAEKRGRYSFSVNLSGNTISDEKFRDYVIDRFEHGAVDPASIQFEITETAAVRHFDGALKFISALSELGCAFALDDFGSGLSSFGYLKQLPVSYLKIDGSFVRKMEVSDVEYSMVSTINHLAHIMGLETIAECVENQAQLAMLEEMGVDYVQGFLISTPVPLASILS